MSTTPRRPSLLVVAALLVSGVAGSGTASSAAGDVAAAPGGYTPPVADSGPNVTVPAGTDAVLAGSVSDPDGDALEIHWMRTVVSGGDLASCTFTGPTAFTPVTPAGLAPTLNCTQPGEYLLQLVVGDGTTSDDDIGALITFTPPDATKAACSVVTLPWFQRRLRIADPETGVRSYSVLATHNLVLTPDVGEFAPPVPSRLISFSRPGPGPGTALIAHQNGDHDDGECVLLVRANGTVGVLN